MSYQDILPGAKSPGRGYRECEGRYRVIAASLAELPRPFTVLDLGASEGYFSCRLAAEFGAFVTAVEARNIPDINHHQRVTWIFKKVTPQEIRDLGEFDVILALSVLHHIREWRETLKALVSITRKFLFVETPHPSERLKQAAARHELKELDSTVRDLGATRVGEAPGVWDKTLSRGLYLWENPGTL